MLRVRVKSTVFVVENGINLSTDVYKCFVCLFVLVLIAYEYCFFLLTVKVLHLNVEIVFM